MEIPAPRADQQQGNESLFTCAFATSEKFRHASFDTVPKYSVSKLYLGPRLPFHFLSSALYSALACLSPSPRSLYSVRAAATIMGMLVRSPLLRRSTT